MKVENTDATGDKCVKDKDNNLVLGNKEKLRVWKAHYEQLLNVEFDWDDSSLHIEPSVEDSAIKITSDMVPEAALKMKEGMWPVWNCHKNGYARCYHRSDQTDN